MNHNPLITVLMPVYNSGLYLNEAIQSILNQTYPHFELIISYDESEDNSLKIIKEFADTDHRIAISYGKGRGIIKALNDGLELANGFYIARMDSDDISLPTRFERQVKFMEANPQIGICGSWIEVFGQVKRKYILKYPLVDKLLKLQLLFSVSFAHPTVFIKHDILKKYGLKYHSGFESIEDYKLWLDLAQHTSFGMIPEVLLNYRHLETSLSKLAQKDESQRYLSFKKIYSELFLKLGIVNSEEENRLHFIMSLNNRIAREKIDFKQLNQYFYKLIHANKSKQFFDEKSLEWLMAKKFLIVVYYKIKNKDIGFLRAIFYRFFWLGPYILLKRKYL